MNCELLQDLKFPLFSLLIFLGAHLVIWRYLKALASLKLLILLAILGFGAGFLIQGALVTSLGIAVYALFIIMYFHLYVGMERSVSIRILEEIRQSENQELTIEQILHTYSPDSMFISRVDWLVQGNWLTRAPDGSLRCTSKAGGLAKILIFFQHFYNLDRTG